MHQAPVSPPEEEGDPDRLQTGSQSSSCFSPQNCQLFSAGRSASRGKLGIQGRSDSRAGPFCPSEPHQVDEAASVGTSMVADVSWRAANSDQTADTQRQLNPNRQTQGHLPSNLMMGSIQPQIQAHESPFNLNVLPGPSPLSLQASPSGARVQSQPTPLLPELMLTPGPPRPWMNPVVLVPFNANFCPFPWLHLPEVLPSWCSCPENVRVNQPCDPGPLPRTTGEPVSEQLNVTPEPVEKEQRKVKAKSGAKRQKNGTPLKDKLQAKNTDKKRTRSMVFPGSLPSLDEETLAECAFEEYMTIMDSLCAKISENVEGNENEEGDDGEKEKLETENRIFLEYLDELCSDEDFVRKVESTLDMEYLNSLLSSDPKPLDLLAPEKQARELGLAMNTENPVSSHPEPLHLIPLKEPMQEASEATVDANGGPATDETSPATSRVEERAQTPILDPLATKFDTKPNHDGQNPPLSTRIRGFKEEPLLTDATPEYFDPVSASSCLCDRGSFPMDNSSTLSLHSEPDASDLEGTGSDALAATFLARSEPRAASGSPTTSSVAGSTEDPRAIPGKDPASSFRADSLTDSPPHSAGPPPLRVPAWKTAQLTEPEDQGNPRNINPKSSCLKDKSSPHKHDLNNANPSSSFVVDAHPDSCDPPVDGSSLSSVPEKQMLEAPKGLQVSHDGNFSEFRTRERRGFGRKCEKNKEKSATASATQKEAATKAIEEGMTKMTFESEGENREKETKLQGTSKIVILTRRSLTTSDCDKEKVGLSSEFISEQHTTKLTEEIQKLKAEAGEPSEASDSIFNTETGVGNALSSKTPQEKSKRDKGRVQRREEGVQMSSFVRRRTRSITAEEKVQLTHLPAAGDRRRTQHSETERSEIKATAKREIQDELEGNVKEKANRSKQSVLSPTKRSRSARDEEESGEEANGASENDLTGCEANESKVSENSPPALSCLRSPRVKADTPSIKDMVRADKSGQKVSKEATPNEKNEHKHRVSKPKSSPILRPESIQLNPQESKTEAPSEDGAGGHSEAVAETTRRSSSPEPSPDQTAGLKGERINGGEAEKPSPTSSPVKRNSQERLYGETETKVNETDNEGTETEIRKSPVKRPKWKSKAEDETLGIGAPRTRSKTKAEDKTPSGDESGAMKTRMSLRRIQVPCFPREKQTRLSAKLPTKCKDFTLCKPKVTRQKRQLNKAKGKRLRGGKTVVD